MPKTTCIICNKLFYAKPSHIKKGWGKYCCIECRTKGQFTGKNIKCFICNKEVYKQLKEIRKSKSGKHFCGKSCQTIWRNKYLFSGKNHTNWINGESSYREVLKRAGITRICSLCHTTDFRILVVHHKDKNRKNNSIENLMWLCHNCHYLVHHFGNEKSKIDKM